MYRLAQWLRRFKWFIRLFSLHSPSGHATDTCWCHTMKRAWWFYFCNACSWGRCEVVLDYPDQHDSRCCCCKRHELTRK